MVLAINILSSPALKPLLIVSKHSNKGKWDALVLLAKTIAANSADNTVEQHPQQITQLLAAYNTRNGWMQPSGEMMGTDENHDHAKVALRALSLLETSRFTEEKYSKLAWEALIVFYGITLADACQQLVITGLVSLIEKPKEVAKWTNFLLARIPFLLRKLIEIVPSEDEPAINTNKKSTTAGTTTTASAATNTGSSTAHTFLNGPNILTKLGISGRLIKKAEAVVDEHLQFKPPKHFDLETEMYGCFVKGSLTVSNKSMLKIDSSRRISLNGLKTATMEPETNWTMLHQKIKEMLSWQHEMTIEYLEATASIPDFLNTITDIMHRAIAETETTDGATEMRVRCYNVCGVIHYWVMRTEMERVVIPKPNDTTSVSFDDLLRELLSLTPNEITILRAVPILDMAKVGADVGLQLCYAISAKVLAPASVDTKLKTLAETLPFAFIGLVDWLRRQLDGSLAVDSWAMCQFELLCSCAQMMNRYISSNSKNSASNASPGQPPSGPVLDMLKDVVHILTEEVLCRNYQYIGKDHTVLKDTITQSSLQQYHHRLFLQSQVMDIDSVGSNRPDRVLDILINEQPPQHDDMMRLEAALEGCGARWFGDVVFGAFVQETDKKKLNKIRDLALVTLLKQSHRLDVANVLFSQVIPKWLVKMTTPAQITAAAELSFFVVASPVQWLQTLDETDRRQMAAVLTAVLRLANDLLDSGAAITSLYPLTLIDRASHHLGPTGMFPLALIGEHTYSEIQRLAFGVRAFGKVEHARVLFDLTSERGRAECALFFSLPTVPVSLSSSWH